jgi:rubrerythrin
MPPGPKAAPVEANEHIRELAQARVADQCSIWEFLCECGQPDCAERVRISIALYDQTRDEHGSVLARGHLRSRARATRDWSADVRDEAQAVRNQARQQIRRTERRRRIGPFPELVCDECGYSVCVPDPPDACPMCNSTAWHLRHR